MPSRGPLATSTAQRRRAVCGLSSRYRYRGGGSVCFASATSILLAFSPSNCRSPSRVGQTLMLEENAARDQESVYPL